MVFPVLLFSEPCRPSKRSPCSPSVQVTEKKAVIYQDSSSPLADTSSSYTLNADLKKLQLLTLSFSRMANAKCQPVNEIYSEDRKEAQYIALVGVLGLKID